MSLLVVSFVALPVLSIVSLFENSLELVPDFSSVLDTLPSIFLVLVVSIEAFPITVLFSVTVFDFFLLFVLISEYEFFV